MATKPEIQQAITRLMQAFTAFKPDPEDMKGFIALVYEKLSGFHVSVINQAVEQIIEREIYFPRIAEMMSYCYRITDEKRSKLAARWADLKQDWYGDKVHPKEVWQKLADEYRQMGWTGTAQSVMDDYEKYKNVCKPITPEQAAMLSKKLAGMAEKMGGSK